VRSCEASGDIYPMSAAYLPTQIADSDSNTDTLSPLKELFLYETVRGKYLGQVLWFKEGKDIHSLSEKRALSIESVMLESLSCKKFHNLLSFAGEQPINVAHYIGLNILAEYLSITPDVSDEQKNVIEKILERATQQELYGEKIIPILVEMDIENLNDYKKSEEKDSKNITEKVTHLLQEVLQLKSYNSPYLASYVLVHSLFQKQEEKKVLLTSDTIAILPLQKFQEKLFMLPKDLQERYDSWSKGLHSLSLEDVQAMYRFVKKDESSTEYQILRKILISARDIVLARLENASFPQTNEVVLQTKSYGVKIPEAWAFQHCRDIFSFFRGFRNKNEIKDLLPLDFLLREGFIKQRKVESITQKNVSSKSGARITDVSDDLSDSFCSEMIT